MVFPPLCFEVIVRPVSTVGIPRSSMPASVPPASFLLHGSSPLQRTGVSL